MHESIRIAHFIAVSNYDVIACSHDFDFASLLQKALHDENDAMEPKDLTPSSPSLMDEVKEVTPQNSATAPSYDVCEKPNGQLKRSSSKSQSGSHTRRKKRRQEEKSKMGQIPKPEIIERHVRQSPAIISDLDICSIPVASGAYVANNVRPIKVDEICTKEQLVKDYGFRVIAWNGRCVNIYIYIYV
jgi:hypothetical protein